MSSVEEDTDLVSDTYNTSDDTLSDDTLSEQTLDQMCPDPSVVTLENYTKDDLRELFVIKLQTSSGKFKDTGSCMTKTELREALMVDRPKIMQLQKGNEDPPGLFMSVAIPPKDNNVVGRGYKPTAKIVVKLNLASASIFVTLGSIKRILTENNKVWYAVKMYGGKRRRIGNLSGMALIIGANHAQVPGFYVYKLVTASELKKGVNTNEELSDFFLDDDSLHYYTTYDNKYLLRVFDTYIHPVDPTSQEHTIGNDDDSSTIGNDDDSASWIDEDNVSVISNSLFVSETSSEHTSDDTNDNANDDTTNDNADDFATDEVPDQAVVVDYTSAEDETTMFGKEKVFGTFENYNDVAIDMEVHDSYLLVADNKKRVYVWDLETSKLIHKFKTGCSMTLHKGMIYYSCQRKIKARPINSNQDASQDEVIADFGASEEHELRPNYSIVQFEIYEIENRPYILLIIQDENTLELSFHIFDLTYRQFKGYRRLVSSTQFVCQGNNVFTVGVPTQNDRDGDRSIDVYAIEPSARFVRSIRANVDLQMSIHNNSLYVTQAFHPSRIFKFSAQSGALEQRIELPVPASIVHVSGGFIFICTDSQMFCSKIPRTDLYGAFVTPLSFESLKLADQPTFLQVYKNTVYYTQRDASVIVMREIKEVV
jgi:hypothetical protein